MCIRDRATGAAAGRRPGPPTTARIPSRHARPAPAHAQNGRCLLYTSDAADERSSVDLGGRRIIKKKKNSNKYTVYLSRNKLETTQRRGAEPER